MGFADMTPVKVLKIDADHLVFEFFPFGTKVVFHHVL
jgi:hypothetical protein